MNRQSSRRNKRLEVELHRSEEELRQVVNAIPALVWTAQPDGSLDFINQTHVEFTGLSLDKAKDWHWVDVIHPDDRSRLLKEWRTALATGETLTTEARLQRASGDYRWMLIRTVPLRDQSGKIIKWYGTKTDITDLKQTEEALRNEEKKYRSLFEQFRDLIVMIDLSGKILDINPSVERITGYPLYDLKRMNVYDLLVLEDHELVHRILANLGKGKPQTYQYRWKAKNGAIIYFDGSSVARFSESGEFLSTLCVLRDITESKRAEEAVRKSEQVLREAESLGHTGSWEWNLPTGEIFSTEENLRLVFGDTRRKDAVIDAYFQAVHPEDYQHVMQSIESIKEEGGGNFEFRVVWPDGSIHVLVCHIKVFRDELGQPVRLFGTNVDITERKRAEKMQRTFSQRLLEAQENERRQISLELHDEIGQNLTAIKFILQSYANISDPVPNSPDVNRAIDQVDLTLKEIRNLSLNLRPSMLDHLGLHATVKWFLEEITQSSKIKYELNSSIENKRFNQEIEICCFRVIQSAVINSIKHSGASQLIIHLWNDNRNIYVRISDNGKGFNVQDAFINAERGKSMGLLNMRERAALLDGELKIKSDYSKGTEVLLTLPLRK